MTPQNQGEFHAFADWLRDIGSSVGLDPDHEWALDVTFDEMVASIPGTGESATSAPQPGTPLVRHLADRAAKSRRFTSWRPARSGRTSGWVGRDGCSTPGGLARARRGQDGGLLLAFASTDGDVAALMGLSMMR